MPAPPPATAFPSTTLFRSNPDGIPEFVRSRKALQFANSIDDYVATMIKGDNGGYANDWLIGDRKTGEIAYLDRKSTRLNSSHPSISYAVSCLQKKRQGTAA